MSDEKVVKVKKPIVKLTKPMKIIGRGIMTDAERKFFLNQMVLGVVAQQQKRSAKKTVLEYARIKEEKEEVND